MGMLNKDYAFCLEALFKGDVESAVSIFFDCKQCFDQHNWNWAKGLGHATPWTLSEEEGDTFQTADHLRRPCTIKFGLKTEAVSERAAGHS